MKLPVVAGLAGAFLVGVVALPGAKALDRPGEVRISGSEVRHVHVDGGIPGASVGDLDVYGLRLFNKRIRAKAIGRGTITCISVGGTRQSCTGTYFLPKGSVVTQGLITSQLIYELAVIGGTGLYSNVRGTLTVTSLTRKPPTDLLVFRLSV
jgi:hypothetical protein